MLASFHITLLFCFLQYLIEQLNETFILISHENYQLRWMFITN